MTASPDLRQTTLDLLEMVQTVSGYPVVVEPNRQLATTAALRMARGPLAIHRIEYNPDLAAEPDYYVAVQCGQVLRFFAPPPAKSVDLAYSEQGMTAVRDLVRRDTAGRLGGIGNEVIETFAAKLYHGLMQQIRSVPVELRVEEWIFETFPEFGSVQRAAVLRQLEENARSLSSSTRSMSPARVFKASITMNAAAAQFWAGTYLMPELVKPYSLGGFAGDGAQLLATWRKAIVRDAPDQEVIDSWASLLKIRGWYDWVPYDAPVRP